jgi:hypothetical protein
MSPFLMASLLAYRREAMLPQNSNHFPGRANRKAIAHVSATSNTFAPAGKVTCDGSNQRARASFALQTASSSLSPAEAQPGSSGKNAPQRFVCGSCSTTSRSFIAATLLLWGIDSNHQWRAHFSGVDMEAQEKLIRLRRTEKLKTRGQSSEGDYFLLRGSCFSKRLKRFVVWSRSSRLAATSMTRLSHSSTGSFSLGSK